MGCGATIPGNAADWLTSPVNIALRITVPLDFILAAIIFPATFVLQAVVDYIKRTHNKE